MRIKDILTVLLSSVGVIAVGLLVMGADSIPMNVLFFIAAFLWLLLLIITIVDARKTHNEPTLWMVRNGEWHAQDGSGRTEPMLRQNTQIFDQDNIQYKEEV